MNAPIDPLEAKGTLEYVRDLMQRTRTTVEDSWRALVRIGLWQFLGLIGIFVIVRWDLDPKYANWTWHALFVVTVLPGILLGRSRRKPPTDLDRRRSIALLVFVLVAGAVLFLIPDDEGAMWFTGDGLLLYVPVFVGCLCILDGLFFGKTAIALGAWVIGAAVAGRFMPLEVRLLWMAFAFGGTLTAVGFVLRRRLRTPEATTS
jgi:hypothetical protein